MAKYKVKYSTTYTGTRTKLGRWINPKEIQIEIPAKTTNKNAAIMRAIKRKARLKKDFSWWGEKRIKEKVKQKIIAKATKPIWEQIG